MKRLRFPNGIPRAETVSENDPIPDIGESGMSVNGDTLRDRILHTLINNTPPKYLAMPGDLSDLVTALISELKLEREDGECMYCQSQLPCGRWVAWDE